MTFRFLSLAIAISVIGFAGCTQKSSPSAPISQAGPLEAPAAPATIPELGQSQLIQPGIQFQEAALRRGAMQMRVWYYQPAKAADKLALVLVPPAGSTLFAGMSLGDGDRTEQYPYVKAGFAVAAFDIDGNAPENASDAATLKAAREFRDANAGVANAALDFILAKVPNIDPARIYIAGHSSAATLALLVAENEPRIKGCAAYAPVTDVETRLAPVIAQLDIAIPGYRTFIRESSPKTHAERLKCPVFLFHAQDDATVPIRQTINFAAQVKKTNSQVTLVQARNGGHYDSMIREGLPKGIEWFRQLPKAAR